MKNIDHKKRQIKHFDNFRYNVSEPTFIKVKRYHTRNVLDLIKDIPRDNHRVLYIACGTGYEILLLGKGVGTDISFNCVKNVIRLGFKGVVCDVENLPFANNCFDFVFCNSFHHFYDFNKAFSEIYRVCKWGGRLALGPEAHRYSFYEYLYSTIFRYWRVERNILSLTPKKLIQLFKKYKLKNISYFHKGIDPIAVNQRIERFFDTLTKKLPNYLFFWAHFYITGIK